MTAPSWYRWQGNDLILQLKIQPRASRNGFADVTDDCLKVRLTAPPVDGRANSQLVAFLAAAFGSAKRAVRIVRGANSRQKVVCIQAPKRLPPQLGLKMPDAAD